MPATQTALAAVSCPLRTTINSSEKQNPPERPTSPGLRQVAETVATQFERFGAWGDRISVVRDGAVREVARHQATAGSHRSNDSEALWQACQTELPLAFRDYQIVVLDAPSFFLPAGEAVFKVTENPMQLPDNPPQGVMMRHLEAMNAHPLAKFYLLEPVFTSDPYFRLYTADDLREEAAGDHQVVEQIVRHFGWWYRTVERCKTASRRLASLAIRSMAAVVERLAVELMPRGRATLSRAELARLLRDGEQTDDILSTWARSSETRTLDDDRRRLQRAIDELRWRASIDPVLCFELPERPGELWFESHWFTGADGRRYVHY